MTVAELITKLQTMPQHMTVLLFSLIEDDSHEIHNIQEIEEIVYIEYDPQ